MEENKLDVRKVYEALARIIGERYNVKITVEKIRKRGKTDEKTA